MKTVLAAAALAAGLLAIVGTQPESALAHPLGNFTINRHARIELFRGGTQVHYALDFAEIPTFQALPTIDTDRDGIASPAELSAYARSLSSTVIAGLEVRVGGERLDLRGASAEAVMVPGGSGLDVLRVDLLLTASTVGSSEPRPVVVTDRNYEDRVGWKEIVVDPTEGTRAEIGALGRDTSDGLRTYPTVDLTSAPDMRSVSFNWATDSGASAPGDTRARESSIAPRVSGFDALVRRPDSLLVLLASFAAAFGFGAMHALGPGHGKAMVAAYLVGSKGTVRHAVALGMTVTVTHVSMVYLLGFVTLAASAFLVPERVYFALSLASGASVVAMGMGLFVSRMRKLRTANGTDEDAAHRHGLFGATHSHAPESQPVAVAAYVPAPINARHDHVLNAPHSHGPNDHEHDRARDHAATVIASSEGVTWRSLLTLGVLGGLLPCPSALVVMLAAISLGQVVWGMLLIVAFSMWLAFVLTAIGIALVLGARLHHFIPAAWRGHTGGLGRLAGALPAASALGIAVAGLLIVYQTVVGQALA